MASPHRDRSCGGNYDRRDRAGFSRRELPAGSSEEWQCIETFYKTYLNYSKRSQLGDITFSAIKNSDLERSFNNKQDDMYYKGCTKEEVRERFAFQLAKPHIAQQIALRGLYCRPVDKSSSIGVADKGLNLTMHADVILEFAAASGFKPPITLIMFKVCYGRVKAIEELDYGSPPSPTLGYNCHMSKVKADPLEPFPSKVEHSYAYIYDFSQLGELKRRPRQILPFAEIRVGADCLARFAPRMTLSRTIDSRGKDERVGATASRGSARDDSVARRSSRRSPDVSRPCRTESKSRGTSVWSRLEGSSTVRGRSDDPERECKNRFDNLKIKSGRSHETRECGDIRRSLDSNNSGNHSRDGTRHGGKRREKAPSSREYGSSSRSREHSSSRSSNSKESRHSRESSRSRDSGKSLNGRSVVQEDENNNRYVVSDADVLTCYSLSEGELPEERRSNCSSGQKSDHSAHHRDDAVGVCHDLREKLSGPGDLRAKLSSRPHGDLRAKLTLKNLEKLKVQLSSVPLPDLRETLSGRGKDHRISSSKEKKISPIRIRVSTSTEEPERKVFSITKGGKNEPVEDSELEVIHSDQENQVFSLTKVYKDQPDAVEDVVVSDEESQVCSITEADKGEPDEDADRVVIISDEENRSEDEKHFVAEEGIPLDSDGIEFEGIEVDEIDGAAFEDSVPPSPKEVEPPAESLLHSTPNRPADTLTPNTPDASTLKTADASTQKTADALTPKTADASAPNAADALTPKTVDVSTPKRVTELKMESEIGNTCSPCVSPLHPHFSTLSDRFGAIRCPGQASPSVKEEDKMLNGRSCDCHVASSCAERFMIMENLHKIRVSVEAQLNSPDSLMEDVSDCYMSDKSTPKPLRKRKLERNRIDYSDVCNFVVDGVERPKVRKLSKEESSPTGSADSTSSESNKADDAASVHSLSPKKSSESKSVSSDLSLNTQFIIRSLLQQKELAETEADKQAVDSAVTVLLQNLNVVEQAIRDELQAKRDGQNKTRSDSNCASPCPSLIEDDAQKSDTDLSKLGEEFDDDLDEFDDSFQNDTDCAESEVGKGSEAESILNEDELLGSSSGEYSGHNTSGTINNLLKLDSPKPEEDKKEIQSDSVTVDVNSDDNGVDANAEQEADLLPPPPPPPACMMPEFGVTNESPVFEDEGECPVIEERIVQNPKSDEEVPVETRQPAPLLDATDVNVIDMDVGSTSEEEPAANEEALPSDFHYKSTATANLHFKSRIGESRETDDLISPMQKLEGMYGPNSRGYGPSGGWQSSVHKGWGNNPNRWSSNTSVRPPFQPQNNPRVSDPRLQQFPQQNQTMPGQNFVSQSRMPGRVGPRPNDPRQMPRPGRMRDEYNTLPYDITAAAHAGVLQQNQGIRNSNPNRSQNADSFCQSVPVVNANQKPYSGNMTSVLCGPGAHTGGDPTTRPGTYLPNTSNENTTSQIPQPVSDMLHNSGKKVTAAITPFFYGKQDPKTFTQGTCMPVADDPAVPSLVTTGSVPPIVQVAASMRSYSVNAGTVASVKAPVKGVDPKKTKVDIIDMDNWRRPARVTVSFNYPTTVAHARPVFYDYSEGMVVRYTEEVNATGKTHPGLDVTPPMINCAERDQKVDPKKLLFHGRTLLKGNVKPRIIPLIPPYLKHPFKKSGKLETIPMDPRPDYYTKRKQNRVKQKSEEKDGKLSACGDGVVGGSGSISVSGSHGGGHSVKTRNPSTSSDKNKLSHFSMEKETAGGHVVLPKDMGLLSSRAKLEISREDPKLADRITKMTLGLYARPQNFTTTGTFLDVGIHRK